MRYDHSKCVQVMNTLYRQPNWLVKSRIRLPTTALPSTAMVASKSSIRNFSSINPLVSVKICLVYYAAAENQRPWMKGQ